MPNDNNSCADASPNQKKHRQINKKPRLRKTKAYRLAKINPALQERQQQLSAQPELINGQPELAVVEEQVRQSIEAGPWPSLDVESFKSCTMIVGLKNSGKSTLSKYLLSMNPAETVVLDCDCGQNSLVAGSVSLQCDKSHTGVWVGELTPSHNLKSYLQAIKHLYGVYRAEHFTKRLVVNTMGYLSGLGELILYEIFNLVQPETLVMLKSGPEYSWQDQRTIRAITDNISTFGYSSRLYLSGNTHLESQQPVTCQITHYYNPQARSKPKHSMRLSQRYLTYREQKLDAIDKLLLAIHSYRILPQIKKNSSELFQIKISSVPILSDLQSLEEITSGQRVQSMRVILLGKIISNAGENRLVECLGIGFVYQDCIYCDRRLTSSTSDLVGVLSDVLDYDRSFYQLSENKMVLLELQLEKRVQNLALSVRAMGSKSFRNNPSKSLNQ